MLIFDETAVVEFLDATALAIAAARHIKLNWKEYKDSAVINAIYNILPFGAPGWAEVDPGDINKILAERKIESERLQAQFVDAMKKGGARVKRFMDAQAEVHRSSTEVVKSLYREAAQINEAVQAETRRGIARLITIKAGATIVLKSAALAAGGWPAFLIGTGYDVTLNLIDDWEKAPDAKLIGVATKTGDKLWKKGVKDAAKNMANIYKGEASAPEQKIGWLAKRVEQAEEELERIAESNAAKEATIARKLAKDTRRLARAEAAAAQARRGAAVMSGVKWGFFAWDMYKTANRADQEFKAAGYDSSASALYDALPEVLRRP